MLAMTPNRSELRIADLKGRTRIPSKLMNVKVPLSMVQSIDRLAREFGQTKTGIVLALLNEGLAQATRLKSK